MDSKQQLFDAPSQSMGSNDTSSKESHEPLVIGVSLAGANEPKYWLNSNGFIRIQDVDRMYNVINIKLGSSLSSSGIGAQLETVYKHDYNSSLMSRAKLGCFRVYATAVQKTRGGDCNMKYGWYGASKSKINKILAHGFGCPRNDGVYPHGVYFSALEHPINSLESSTTDEDGLRHMLLCGLILGSVEVVNPFSGQENPSSEAFDNGVDNLMDPKKYIVWHTKMNTHILPEFVVSFRTSSSYNSGCLRISQHLRAPYSRWIPFATLVKVLSQSLPCDKTKLVSIYHDYRTQKIMRPEMVQRLRRIAGDRLLLAILKSYNEKKNNKPE